MSFVRRDLARFYYPMWHFGVASLKSGTVPLWNPYINFGQPFLANLQTCAFYPLSIFFYLPDFTWGFNFYVVFHLALAAFFTSLWAREMQLSWISVVVAGLAYSLSGYMMSAINLTISLCSAVYFPLALLCFRRALRSRGFFWKSIVGLCLFIQYLAGDPSILIGTVLVLTLFVIYRTLCASVVERKLVLDPLWALVQAGGVLVLLSAFQSLLFAELILNSERMQLSFNSKMIWSMQYNDLFALIVPFTSDLTMHIMGYWTRQSWLENCYTGVSVMVLAVLGVICHRGSRLMGYHVLLALLGLGLVIGPFSLVYPLLYKTFPFLSFVRYPIRFLFIFTFAVACLAGFGFEAVLNFCSRSRKWSRRSASKKWSVRYLIALLLVTSVLALLFSVFFDTFFAWIYRLLNTKFEVVIKQYYNGTEFMDLIYATASNLKRSILFFGLLLAGILLAYCCSIRRWLVAVYFIFLVVIDLAGANLVEPVIRSSTLKALVPNVRRILKESPPRLFRILASPKTAYLQARQRGRGAAPELTDLKNRLTTNFMMMYGIYDCLGYDSIDLEGIVPIQRIISVLRPISAEGSAVPRNFQLDGGFLNMLNVKYFVSSKSRLPGTFRNAFGSRSGYVYTNPHYLPRAFLAKDFIVEKERTLILKYLASKDFDPEKILYLEEMPIIGSIQGAAITPDNDRVLIPEYKPERIKMRAWVGPKDRWLFLSDTYYPGWKASVDGKPTKIYRANYAFRAIHLQPGQHDIIWSYDPILFKIGSAITLITIFGLGAYYVRRHNALL